MTKQWYNENTSSQPILSINVVEVGTMGEGGQKVQTSSYKINKYLGCI